MVEMVEERRNNGITDGRRDLFSNLLRACDEDTDSELTTRDLFGGTSLAHEPES